MSLLIKFTVFILFYAGSSVTVFLALSRLSRFDRQSTWPMFLISIGIGPVAISWILVQAIRLFPGHGNFFYLTVMLAATLAILAWGWDKNRWRIIQSSATKGFKAVLTWRPVEKIMGVILAVVVLSNLFLAIFAPATENDAIQYITVAKMMIERHSFDFYPVVQPQPNGFYAISSHPLGFMGMYLSTYILQNSDALSPFIKIVSPLFVIFTLSALWGAFRQSRPIYPITASLVLICTPCYFIQSSQLSIDSFRMYLLFAAVLWMIEFCKRSAPDMGMAIAVGVVAGLSMYSHSIGLLFTLPLIMPIYLLFHPKPWREWFRDGLLIVCVALFFGGYRIVANMILFGSPICDHLPVYDLKNIKYNEYVWYAAKMFNLKDKIFHGLLKGFTNLRSFGLSYWLSIGIVPIIFLNFIKKRCGSTERFLLSGVIAVIVLFYGAVILSLCLNMHVFIANVRYLMTIQPFIAITAAFFWGTLYENLENRS